MYAKPILPIEFEIQSIIVWYRLESNSPGFCRPSKDGVKKESTPTHTGFSHFPHQESDAQPSEEFKTASTIQLVFEKHRHLMDKGSAWRFLSSQERCFAR